MGHLERDVRHVAQPEVGHAQHLELELGTQHLGQRRAPHYPAHVILVIRAGRPAVVVTPAAGHHVNRRVIERRVRVGVGISGRRVVRGRIQALDVTEAPCGRRRVHHPGIAIRRRCRPGRRVALVAEEQVLREGDVTEIVHVSAVAEAVDDVRRRGRIRRRLSGRGKRARAGHRHGSSGPGRPSPPNCRCPGLPSRGCGRSRSTRRYGEVRRAGRGARGRCRRPRWTRPACRRRRRYRRAPGP